MSKRFDLSTLAGNAKAVADDAAAAIRDRLNRDTREIGQLLTQAKAALPHGAFLPWLASELQITARTAQRYMHVAMFVEGKCDKLSHLPPPILNRLASPNAPAEIVERVVSAAERGERLDAKVIRDELADAAFQVRMAKREADLKARDHWRRARRKARKTQGGTGA